MIGLPMLEQWTIAIMVIIWLAECAVIDARHGEVSNWLTLPGMAAGIIYAITAGGDRLLLLIVAFGALLLLFILGSMGGADVKVLTALAGLWPAALFTAFLVQGIWGIIVLIKRGRGSEFHAIPAYAVGALLSMILLI